MRLAAFGECMLEMRAQPDGAYRLAYGGDVFNTAVYARQLGLDVSFVSAVGDDHFSGWLLDAWAGHDLNLDGVRRISGATPALYVIRNDEHGERTFTYWRSASPFRRVLQEDRAATAAFAFSHDVVVWSGITLALLPPDDRHWWLEQLAAYQAGGGVVAFDGNYRPVLWRSADEARAWLERAWGCADCALPSVDDELALHGDADPAAVIARVAACGAGEVVLKQGAQGCTVGERHFALPRVETVLDATAAGDAFNAGYLAVRLAGGEVDAAVAEGQRVAAIVVRHEGAICELGS